MQTKISETKDVRYFRNQYIRYQVIRRSTLPIMRYL